MATLGNVPAEAYTNTVKDSFSGNGSTTAFTMSLPTVTNDVRVVVENVIQDPTVAYSVSGTTLTFTSAPPTGTNNIYVVHLGPAVMTTVPPAEIADATTFASSLTVQGAFTSQGIDDNGNATALTIDASGNLLVGNTDTSPYDRTSGNAIAIGDGLISSAQSGGNAAIFNRMTSDGSIVGFRKDGTAVGSIGVTDGDNLYIASTVSNHAGLKFNNTAMGPWVNNTNSNGAMDIGTSVARFKDAYLSGGVNIYNSSTDAVDIRGTGSRCEIDNPDNNSILLKTGGTTRVRIDSNGLLFGSDTASANALDDYEEGTWTPSLGGNATYNFQSGFYTKVGRQVTLVFYLDVSSIGTGSTSTITGQPFASTTFAPASGVISRFQNTAGSYVSASGQIGSSNIVILGKTSASASTSNISPFQNGTAMYMTITYFTS